MKRRPVDRVKVYTVTRYTSRADETPHMTVAQLAGRGLVKLARTVDLERIARGVVR